MKVLFAAATAAALLPAAALAQAAPATGFYGTLGYLGTSTQGVDLGAIQGRLGYRVLPWLGIEGEGAFGVKDDKSTQTVGGVSVNTKVRLRDQEAIYGVGFLPLSEQLELFGRVGYGHEGAKVSASAAGATTPITVTQKVAGDSWNFGGGAQWYFDPKNGVRADYTREEFTPRGAGHADTWAISYTRRF
jgi:outer membrane immunogenic protein